MSDSEDPLDQIDEGGDDLFGDEGDQQSPAPRALDDDELASDPEDDGHRGQYDDEEDRVQHETREKVVMNVQTYRHRLPSPKDGMVRLQ